MQIPPEARAKVAEALRNNPSIGLGRLGRNTGLSKYNLEQLMQDYRQECPEFAARLSSPQHAGTKRGELTESKRKLIAEAYGRNPHPDCIRDLSNEHGAPRSRIIDVILEGRHFATSAERTRAITQIKYGKR